MISKAKSYIKKPVRIEAVQLTGDWEDMCKTFLAFTSKPMDEKDDINLKEYVIICKDRGYIEIQTLEGPMQASPNDYIIRGIKGEYYACKPEIFEASYELQERE